MYSQMIKYKSYLLSLCYLYLISSSLYINGYLRVVFFESTIFGMDLRVVPSGRVLAIKIGVFSLRPVNELI